MKADELHVIREELCCPLLARTVQMSYIYSENIQKYIIKHGMSVLYMHLNHLHFQCFKCGQLLTK